jgi:prolyl 4-hydroxylase
VTSTVARPKSSSKSSPLRRPIRTSLGNGIVVYDNFLSATECQLILDELTVAYWQPSLTYQKQPDGDYLNVLTPFRVSDTAHEEWFSGKLEAMLRRVESRIQKRFGVAPSHLEQWQATDYCRNGKFDYHLDAGYWGKHFAGERLHTFLLYLNTPQKGGGTHFRALDAYVDAKAGRLLIWNNLFPDGECDARMIHSSAPLLRGKKTTLVTWQRQKTFRITKS